MCIIIFYFFYPRKVRFTFVKSLSIADTTYNLEYASFNYIPDAEHLIHFLVKQPKFFNYQAYDSTFVRSLANELDFSKNDYIITWHRKLSQLRYSPYLTRTQDGMYECLEEIPLIPTFDNAVGDSTYIYKIEKNKKFRSPGP